LNSELSRTQLFSDLRVIKWLRLIFGGKTRLFGNNFAKQSVSIFLVELVIGREYISLNLAP